MRKYQHVSVAAMLLALGSWLDPAAADGPIVGTATGYSLSVSVRELAPRPSSTSIKAPRRINPLAGEPDRGRRGTWTRGKPPRDPLLKRSPSRSSRTPTLDLSFDGLANPFACG